MSNMLDDARAEDGCNTEEGYSLRDIVNGEYNHDECKREEELYLSYNGLMLFPKRSGMVEVTIPMHVGTLETFDPDEFDSVLQLVSYLNRIKLREREALEANSSLDRASYQNSLADQCGPRLTEDVELADQNDAFIHSDLSSQSPQ